MRRPEVRRRYWARATLGWPRFSRRASPTPPTARSRRWTGGPAGGRDHPERRSPAPARPAASGWSSCTARSPTSAASARRGEPRAERARAPGRGQPGLAGRAGATRSRRRRRARRRGGRRLRGGRRAAVRRRAEARRGVLRRHACRAHAGRRLGAVRGREVLLVVGSRSLSFRATASCGARGGAVPIAIVNLGPTRADALAAAKVSASVGEILPRLASALGVRS